MTPDLQNSGFSLETAGPGCTDRPPEVNITPFVARQKVNRFVIVEISSQLMGETPEWRPGKRPCWSVPVVLTSPARGVIGKVGDIAVDAATGELLVDEEAVRRMTEDARRLAERSPL